MNTPPALDDRQARYLDELALFFERQGLPRATCRVFAYLLVCTPPEQSSSQLAEALHLSRGAVSTATRALLTAGMIQRHPVPGSRAKHFVVHPDTLDTLLHASVARIQHTRDLAGRGLDAFADRDPAENARLRSFHDVYAFMADAYPALLARWDATRKEGG